MKKLALLTLSYNDAHHILELLESLKSSSYKDFDYLIFDNDSKQSEAKEELKKSTDVKFIQNDKNLGFTGGVNKALEYVNSKYVLLLNSDIILEEDTIKKLLDTIESDEKIAFVSAGIYDYNNKDKIASFGGKMNFFTGVGIPVRTRKNGIRELQYGEYTDACCLIFNKKIFEELGRYDEKYFMYVETEDVEFKAMRNGYKVLIIPEAKVWHKVYGSNSGKKSRRAVYHLTRNRFLFIRKHVSTLQYSLFLILNLFFILPVQFLLFVKRNQTDLLSAFFIGIYDGLRQKHDRII